MSITSRICPLASIGSRWKQAVLTCLNRIALEAGNGFLWSLEQDGTLFKTDPRGNYVQVGGKGEYRGTKMLVSMDGSLYTVEGGTLYRTR